MKIGADHRLGRRIAALIRPVYGARAARIADLLDHLVCAAILNALRAPRGVITHLEVRRVARPELLRDIAAFVRIEAPERLRRIADSVSK